MVWGCRGWCCGKLEVFYFFSGLIRWNDDDGFLFCIRCWFGLLGGVVLVKIKWGMYFLYGRNWYVVSGRFFVVVCDLEWVYGFEYFFCWDIGGLGICGIFGWLLD